MAQPDILIKMKALAESYLPEWSFAQQNPDAGSVIALLYKAMLEGSLARYDKVMRKHKIQYLNLFDKFKEEPVESAKSYVQFTPVAGAPDAIHIPRGVRLFAEGGKAEGQIAFETVHGITVTPAALSSVCVTDSGAGAIVRKFSAEDGDSLQNLNLTAFHADGENLEEHILLLGFTDALGHLSRLDIELIFSAPAAEEPLEIQEILCGENIRFSLLLEDGFEEFDLTERTERGVRLVKENFSSHKEMLLGHMCSQIAISAQALQDVQINGVETLFAGNDLLPDEVRCGGISQNTGHFYPFGLPMEIYAACEIESGVVFARKGARAVISFTLDFEVVERLLPQYEVEEEYRVVMKRAAPVPKPAVLDVRADYVLAEYLSETGWKRLILAQETEKLFDASRQGEITLPFTVPADIISTAHSAGQPRLRFRLVTAEGLYQIPCRQHCPVISGLRLSYSYAETPLTPDFALTRNNFETLDITELLRKRRNVSLFYTNEHKNPAIYFGFDKSPWGTPLSLYLRLENNADYPVDMTAEYCSASGFLPLKMADGTGGMLNSGDLRMMVPREIHPKVLFGRELYWLRLINHNRESKSYNLPLITGIYLNMAKVENVHTQTGYFYTDSSGGNTQINLDGQGLRDAKVYVNEEDGCDGENWVKWQKSRSHEGRVYSLDLAAGQVKFGKTAFAAFPVKEDGPSVKVVYQTYRGSAANVETGGIHSLASSIRYISEVKNPIPAYGGSDGFNEETSASIISNMLRTRGRAVTEQDYFDMISQVSHGIRRIKCVNDINPGGENQKDTLTIAILIDEYEKGSHIFSETKETIKEKLLSDSGLLPSGKSLILTQPRFVRMSARLWLECERMESAYALQQQCGESIRRFIDPLSGGFDGRGWEIGTLPTTTQLIAYLKIRHPDAVAVKIVMTAAYENREVEVDDRIGRHITSPFAMAVNGEHMVYCRLMEG
jgi:hypothetical protein